MDTRKLLAEAVGTFTLVGFGSLAIVGTLATSGPVLAIVPFGFGLGLLAAIAITGHISGGHYNPAVTLAAFVDRRLDLTTAIGYVVAQVVGATAASAVVLVLSDSATVAATKNGPGTGFTDVQAFVAEVVLTALFLAVILTVTRRDPGHAWLTIPLTLLVIHVAGIPISGASVNPARALGPALISGDLTFIWIYLTAPFAGALVGWGLYRLLGNEAGD